MITIRLARTGRKNLAWFKLVLQPRHVSPKSAKYIAVLGSYNPSDKSNKIEGLDVAVVEKYIGSGAQVSDTAARLLVKNGVAAAQKFCTKYSHQLSAEQIKANEAAAKQALADAKVAAKAKADAAAAAKKEAEAAEKAAKEAAEKATEETPAA